MEQFLFRVIHALEVKALDHRLHQLGDPVVAKVANAALVRVRYLFVGLELSRLDL